MAASDQEERDRLFETMPIEAGPCVFDKHRKHRYYLRRMWHPDRDTIAFIGLNPSIADEYKNDRTVSRCIAFAKNWGYGSVIMLNLFSWIATDPAAMKKVTDPTGDPANAAHIQTVCSQVAKQVIACWGHHGTHMDRDTEIVTLLNMSGVAPYNLGLTKEGHPRHPLYLRGDVEPQEWVL